MPKIEIEVNDEAFDKIQQLVNIENFLINTVPLKRKHRSVEDFVKGCLAINLETFDKVQNLTRLAGLDDLKSHPKYHNRFKEIAKELNVSQRDIVRATGLNQASVSQIFNNKMESNPRLDTFFKIWVMLRCPPINKCLYRVDD